MRRLARVRHANIVGGVLVLLAGQRGILQGQLPRRLGHGGVRYQIKAALADVKRVSLEVPPDQFPVNANVHRGVLRKARSIADVEQRVGGGAPAHEHRHHAGLGVDGPGTLYASEDDRQDRLLVPLGHVRKRVPVRHVPHGGAVERGDIGNVKAQHGTVAHPPNRGIDHAFQNWHQVRLAQAGEVLINRGRPALEFDRVEDVFQGLIPVGHFDGAVADRRGGLLGQNLTDSPPADHAALGVKGGGAAAGAEVAVGIESRADAAAEFDFENIDRRGSGACALGFCRVCQLACHGLPPNLRSQ